MNDLIIHLRRALQEELDATNTYDELLEHVPDNMKPVIEEIKQDEINHQGRLLALILKTDPAQMEYFNKGLDQKE